MLAYSKVLALYLAAHPRLAAPPQLCAAPPLRDDGGDDGVLQQRMQAVREAEEAKAKNEASRLSSRIADLKLADEQERALDGRDTTYVPVICLDAMLPGQRLDIEETTDPTFGKFLRDLGLGGIFMMVSLHPKQRRIRRHGCLVRISQVDALRSTDDGDDDAPVAVRATLVGRRRAVVLQPPAADDRPSVKQRVGRWRRHYDPEGEESALGWGPEPMVAASSELQRLADECVDVERGSGGESDVGDVGDVCASAANAGCWTSERIWLLPGEAEVPSLEPGEDLLPEPRLAASTDRPFDVERTEALLKAVDEWLYLASDPGTFEDANVAASSRRDPRALLDGVLADIGPRPPAYEEPTALALWIGALINPLPALGVAPEIRGRLLEATSAGARLAIAEWGVRRSLANLKGEL